MPTPTEYKAFIFVAGVKVDYWKCRLCSTEIKCKRGAGYTNLKTHANKHTDAVELINAAKAAKREKRIETLGATVSNLLGATFSIDQKDINIHGWIEGIVMANLPFTFVENEWARKYLSLQNISRNTIKKYMEGLLYTVERKLANVLPNTFGVIIDGWTESGTHFLAIFATFVDILGRPNQYLLACSPFGDETSQKAPAVVQFIIDTVFVYEKDVACIGFLVSDNTEVNPCIARLLGVPFIGCMSHRLALAVGSYLESADAINDRDVVGINRIFDYENFAYLNAFINDDGNDLICAADV
jgi:hypothetical protein